MKKKLFFCLTFIFYNFIIFSLPLLRAETDFYFVSSSVNFMELDNEELLEKTNILNKYNLINNVDLKDLMDRYKYHLVFEESEDRMEFLILFELKEQNLPNYIRNNTKFNWKRISKDRNVAFDTNRNYVYSFNQDFLIISNSIPLFFNREKIKYYKDYVDLLNIENIKKLLDLDEDDYKYAYLNVPLKEITYVFDEKLVIKSINFESVDLSFENQDEDLIETLINKDSLELVYKEQDKVFSYLMHKIFPSFEFLNLTDSSNLKNTYAVIGKDFIYGISDFTEEDDPIAKLRDIVSNFVFFTDYKLSLGKDDEIYYIELPLIYKKLYIKKINNSNKLIFSNNLYLVKNIEESPKLNLIIKNNKKYYIDFEEGTKIEKFNTENIKTKIKERI